MVRHQLPQFLQERYFIIFQFPVHILILFDFDNFQFCCFYWKEALKYAILKYYLEVAFLRLIDQPSKVIYTSFDFRSQFFVTHRNFHFYTYRIIMVRKKDVYKRQAFERFALPEMIDVVLSWLGRKDRR